MSNPTAVLNRLAAQCSRRETCSSQILARLAKTDLEAVEIDRILSTLIRLELVNDRRYALAFAKDRFKFKGWGARKIAASLRQKQISATYIEEALSAIPKDENRDRLAQLLAIKNRSVRQTDPQKRKASLLRFALSKGYDYEVAIETVDTLLKGIKERY